MATVTAITTGFLAGNLFSEGGYDEDASARNFRDALWTALEEAYPDAEIEVGMELHAGGSLPYSLQTRVSYSDGETHDEAYDPHSDVENVTAIHSRVFEAGDWYVELSEEVA